VYNDRYLAKPKPLADTVRMRATGPAAMFRLIVIVKRGSASNLPATWSVYPTLDAAREAGRSLMRNERVAHVMIVRNTVPPVFVEWVG